MGSHATASVCWLLVFADDRAILHETAVKTFTSLQTLARCCGFMQHVRFIPDCSASVKWSR